MIIPSIHDYSWLLQDYYKIIRDYWKIIARLLQDYYKIIIRLLQDYSGLLQDYSGLLQDSQWLLQDYSWLFMIIQTVQQFCKLPHPKTDVLWFYEPDLNIKKWGLKVAS